MEGCVIFDAMAQKGLVCCVVLRCAGLCINRGAHDNLLVCNTFLMKELAKSSRNIILSYTVILCQTCKQSKSFVQLFWFVIWPCLVAFNPAL